MIYKIFTTIRGDQVIFCKKETGEEFWIPIDESNYDYKNYLKWLDDGGVADSWSPDIDINGGK